MKHLIIALAAAVAVTTAFARITVQQGFETDMVGFVSSDSQEDASTNVTYAAESMAKPSDSLAPYPFSEFGDGFLSLDTGDATLWRTNTVEGDVYLDMVMQFNPCTAAPDLESEGTKIAVYLNSDSNLVVMAGTSALDRTPTNYVTTAQLEPGTWGRLTISATVVDGSLAFGIRLNGVALTDGTTSVFPCLTADTTVKEVGFSGTGALDNFVARTTDPYIQNPTVQIGGEGYASIQAALTDAGASSVIELLANNSDAVTLGEGESLKLREGEYAYNGTITPYDGYVLGTPTTVDGVTTYSQVEGVAKVYGDDDAWKWFASFADAFTYARAQSYQPKMTFKVGSDFTPDISSDFGVWMLEFVATTEDPITINLANGNAKLVSAYITFPTTATLNAVSGSVSSMKGGTLNVPSGVVLELASYATDGTSWNITGLTGSGTIKNDGKSMYYFLGNPAYNLPTRMRESTWRGTLELSGSNTWEAEFNRFANANSKVRFNGLTTPLWGTGNDTVAIELVGDGLTITGTHASACTNTIGGAVTGSGALNVMVGGTALTVLEFTGDVSAFAGSVSFGNDANACVAFGTGDKTVASAKAIEVLSGASASVGSGATWTASNLTVGGTLGVAGTLTATGTATVNNGAAVNVTGALVTSSATPTVNDGGSLTIAAGGTWTIPAGGAVVHGVLTVNGNVVDTADAVGKIYSNTGTGKVIANSANACVLGNASNWRGTFVIGWNPTGAFNPNNYGNHVSDTVVLTKDLADNAYFGPGTVNALTINPTVKLEADVSIKNGFSAVSDDYLVTFTKLTGDYNFTTSQGGGTDGGKPKVRYYAITTLDNFNGKLTVPSSSVLRIGTVNVTNGTDLTGCIVSADCQAGTPAGTIPGYPALTVAGVDSGKLVYTTKDAVSGLYRAVAKVGDDYYATWADAFANRGAATTVEKVADVDPDPSVVPAGWSVDVDGSGNYVKDSYLIRFVSGEGSLTNDYTKAYGDATEIPTAAEVTGKSFSAWEPEVAATVTGAAEYTALYTNNVYTLTVAVGENMTVAVYTNGVAEAAGGDGVYALEYGNSVRVEYTAAKDYKITTDTSTNIVGIVEDVVVAAATVEACVYYTAVTLNKATTSIETNLTETLEATFTPASAADDSYTWASSDISKATVDQNGVVTAIAAGEVTITVTATHNPLVTASCTVTVTATSPTPPVAPIDPASGGERTYADAAAAAAARDAINADKETNIPIPSAAATGMTTEQKAAYYGNVTAVAEGTTVKIEFTEAGTNAVQVIADNASTNAVFSSAVSAAAAAGASGSGSATVAAAPGLYYSVESTDDLGTPMTEGDRVLATGSTVTLTVPNKGAAGFYKVKVSPTAKKSE